MFSPKLSAHSSLHIKQKASFDNMPQVCAAFKEPSFGLPCVYDSLWATLKRAHFRCLFPVVFCDHEFSSPLSFSSSFCCSISGAYIKL